MICKLLWTVVLLVPVNISAPLAAIAAETLQWKFQEGEVWLVKLTQKIEAKTALRDKELQLTSDMKMEFRFRVSKVGSQGVAQLTTSLTRVTIRMEIPGTDPIQYDSSQQEVPRGELRELAASISPLINVKFMTTINLRGEIVSVLFPDQTSKKSKNSNRGNSAIESIFSKQGLKQILRQSFGLLPPKAIKKGQTWSKNYQVFSPLGQIKQHSTFTYLGDELRNGHRLKKISVETKIELPQPANAKDARLKIQQQQQTGEYYFDSAAGRMVESEITQRLVVESSNQGKLVKTESTSLLRMTIVLR